LSISSARDALGRVFYQRCFYLFVLLLALIAAAPFVEPTPHGRLVTGAINAFLIISTVAAIGRTMLSFVIALLLAAPAIGFHFVGVLAGDPQATATGWMFSALLYAATIVYLLRYVFQPEVMTADKLYGAAAAYLMLGVAWGYAYALIDYHYPRSFSAGGTVTPVNLIEAVYFSFTVLTSTGFGDIVPLRPQARAICVVEQVVGALFVAILIARLAGVYPPNQRDDA
jgi:hypothetical protein